MCDHMNWDEIRTDGGERWGSGGSTGMEPPDGMDAPLLHDVTYLFRVYSLSLFCFLISISSISGVVY